MTLARSRSIFVGMADSDFRRKQALVATLGLLASAVVSVVGLHATTWFAAWLPPADDPATRLAFAVHWLLAPGCALLAGVQVAAGRGFHPDAIDGTRTPKSHALEIALRYNRNTVEQTVLAAIAWLGLAVGLPHAGLAFIPAMAVLFVVGRATFWAGYLVYPTARAFGMVMTTLPTIVAYGWLLFDACRGR